MIVQSLDRILSGVSLKSGVRLTLANITDTARTAERNHLCGPVAGLIQAELVGGAALLGTLLEHPDETITLRVNFPDGLLGGAMMECRQNYDIRGYTRQKVLQQLDESDDPNEVLFDRALGKRATCAVVRANATRELATASFNLDFDNRLSISDLLEEYFSTSLQRHALVQLSAFSCQGYVACAHALLCEFLPNASGSLRDHIEALFTEGVVQDTLDDGADLATMAHVLGVDPPQEIQSHPVRFACSCSSERVLAMLRGMPSEVQSMIAEDRNFDIYCHLCGKGYTITPEQLKSLL